MLDIENIPEKSNMFGYDGWRYMPLFAKKCELPQGYEYLETFNKYCGRTTIMPIDENVRSYEFEDYSFIADTGLDIMKTCSCLQVVDMFFDLNGSAQIGRQELEIIKSEHPDYEKLLNKYHYYLQLDEKHYFDGVNTTDRNALHFGIFRSLWYIYYDAYAVYIPNKAKLITRTQFFEENYKWEE